jgi:formate dehydrogenase subunit gamma
VLDFPNFGQGRADMQLANIVHAVAAIAMLVLSFGHIYMGTIGVHGAYASMKTGYVDETWAREHHEEWYNDVKAGKSGHPQG